MFMLNFSLWFTHKMSLNEVEGMIPWERDVYVKLVTEYIESENKRIAEENAKRH